LYSAQTRETFSVTKADRRAPPLTVTHLFPEMRVCAPWRCNMHALALFRRRSSLVPTVVSAITRSKRHSSGALPQRQSKFTVSSNNKRLRTPPIHSLKSACDDEQLVALNLEHVRPMQRDRPAFHRSRRIEGEDGTTLGHDRESEISHGCLKARLRHGAVGF
jgi:hypothetical protein